MTPQKLRNIGLGIVVVAAIWQLSQQPSTHTALVVASAGIGLALSLPHFASE